ARPDADRRRCARSPARRRPSWVTHLQLGAERLVEAVGEIRRRDAERELRELRRAQLLAELLDQSWLDLHARRHLLGIADHEPLELVEKRARLVVRQSVELLLRHADSLTES